jgi:hypothetical protein
MIPDIKIAGLENGNLYFYPVDSFSAWPARVLPL